MTQGRARGRAAPVRRPRETRPYSPFSLSFLLPLPLRERAGVRGRHACS